MLRRKNNLRGSASRRFGLDHRLNLERLEERAMMDGVPVLNSLPNAPKTIFLDFDGHFQSVWNRTDAAQTYLNVSTGPYNTDNTAGFSTKELADIKEIWQGVAEDYAPFNVNVTTVEPPAAAFQTNQALRVVIAGTAFGQLYDPHFTTPFTFTTFDNIGGNSFITDNKMTPTGNSGYSSLNSFNTSEPNVVYVFSNIIRGWSATDQEGNTRNFNAVIATTASHEAGHAFNLVHHTGKDAKGNATDYDIGNSATTPIMGDNSEADRTVWSKNSTQDTVAKLTTALGARPDDFGDTYATAGGFTSYTVGADSRGNWNSSMTVQGVISKTTDIDCFKFSSNGGYYTVAADGVKLGNLDIHLDVLQKIDVPLYGSFLTSYASVDPAIPSNQPFAGLSAGMYGKWLPKGDYVVAVSSHGTYGDLGQYTLTVSGANTSLFIPYVPPLVQPPKGPIVAPGPVALPVLTNPLLLPTLQLTGGVQQTAAAPKVAALPAAKLRATDSLFGDNAAVDWMMV